MNTEFVQIDRSALKDWEAAQAHAEACRQDWLDALKKPQAVWIGAGGWLSGSSVTMQAAINYAEAANAEAVARERYSDFVMETLETEHLRERLAELAL